MPFLVVLYAADREHADMLVTHNSYVSRPVGMYRIPTRSEPTCSGLCNEYGWKRALSGRWVHACGRLRRGWRRTFAVALMDTLGINLLPRKKTPAMFRNPEGWGS